MTLSVIVTGGSGFLGAFIIEAILKQHSDWTVIVLDLFRPEIPKTNVQYEIGDVTDGTIVRSVIETFKPQVVVHAAGIVPELAERYGRRLTAKVFEINVKGTRTMLAAAKAHGVQAFVWTGSCCAVTDDMTRDYANVDETVPTSNHSLIYGESKVG